MARTARSAIVKYLKEEKIPFRTVNDKNILVMRANSRYHYCVVEFFDMPEEWYSRQQYFKFKRIYPGQNSNSIITKLNEYLYENTCREVDQSGESTSVE
jgi:hypothetical protein